MRRSSEVQTQILVQPNLAGANWLAMQVNPGDPSIEFMNVGQGPAYGVVFAEKTNTFEGLQFWVRPHAIPYVGTRETKVEARWQFRTEQDQPGVWTKVGNGHRFYLGGIPGRWVFPLDVTYRDVAGRRYRQTLNAEDRPGPPWFVNFTPPSLVKEMTRWERFWRQLRKRKNSR